MHIGCVGLVLGWLLGRGTVTSAEASISTSCRLQGRAWLEPLTMAVIPEDSSASDIEPQVDEQAFFPSAEAHVSVDSNSNDAIPSLRRQDQMHTSPDKSHGVATGCLPAHFCCHQGTRQRLGSQHNCSRQESHTRASRKTTSARDFPVTAPRRTYGIGLLTGVPQQRGSRGDHRSLCHHCRGPQHT